MTYFIRCLFIHYLFYSMLYFNHFIIFFQTLQVSRGVERYALGRDRVVVSVMTTLYIIWCWPEPCGSDQYPPLTNRKCTNTHIIFICIFEEKVTDSLTDWLTLWRTVQTIILRRFEIWGDGRKCRLNHSLKRILENSTPTGVKIDVESRLSSVLW